MFIFSSSFNGIMHCSCFFVVAAISALKVESEKCRACKSEPVFEEFIPLKKECDQRKEIEKEKECRDKKNWMSSFQLWNNDDKADNNNNAYECDKKHNYRVENKVLLIKQDESVCFVGC